MSDNCVQSTDVFLGYLKTAIFGNSANTHVRSIQKISWE